MLNKKKKKKKKKKKEKKTRKKKKSRRERFKKRKEKQKKKDSRAHTKKKKKTTVILVCNTLNLHPRTKAVAVVKIVPDAVAKLRKLLESFKWSTMCLNRKGTCTFSTYKEKKIGNKGHLLRRNGKLISMEQKSFTPLHQQVG